MKRIKVIIAAFLMLAMTVGMFAALGGEKAQAATKPAKAKVTAKANDDGTSVTLTIAKTKKAQGYQIMVKKPGAKKFTKLAAISEDGTAKRTYTAEKLAEGEYQFKVRAYLKNGKKTVWGKYSKVAKVKVASKSNEDKGSTETGSGIVSDLSKAKRGNSVIFGSYEQDNDLDNGKEPIEWIVLSNNGSELFVLSKYALDCMPYNSKYVAGETWEISTLRSWLNDDFYNAAFSDAEKTAIKTTKLKNNDNPNYGTNGGNDTEDNVFLLSTEDMINTSYGFYSEYDVDDIANVDKMISRRCAPTAYAIARTSLLSAQYYTEEGKAACWWRLRSPGGDSSLSTFVGEAGYVELYGIDNGLYYCSSIRPAIVISIK
jgi:hypothetical protein